MLVRPNVYEQMERLHRIGIALSIERNLERLLEMIVEEARRFTGADGGTLYLVSENGLEFEIIQTESLDVRMGGATGAPITWSPVPLVVDGQPNYANVSAYAVLHGTIVNISDVYEAEGYDFRGTRSFDARVGYRSRSILVVPMRDHEGMVIGVLQLLNAKDPATGAVIPFDARFEPLVESLASQAAVAIDNVRLISGMEQLFEAFVRVMASAIDERSPATTGHIERVTELTMALAEAVNACDDPPFAGIELSDDELNELRIAALVHDVGKVTTPLHIIEKRTKLEGIHDRIDVIEQRFELIKQTVRNQFLKKRLRVMEGALSAGAGQGSAPESIPEVAPASTAGPGFAPEVDVELSHLAAEEKEAIAQLDADRAFVIARNTPAEFMPDEDVQRLREIAAKTYVHGGVERPYIEPEELALLSIQRGNISGDELQTMRDHAAVTIRLLAQIPFIRKLQNVPRYAGAHHEKLNGTGYPLGLTADDIPLQTRMIAIADVYEALTAEDRSYKQGRSQEDALRILGLMVKDGELDRDLVDLFVRSGAYKLCGRSKIDIA